MTCSPSWSDSAFGYFAGENIDQIYAAVQNYKWYVIAALALGVAAYIVHRVRRRRATDTA